MRVIWQGPGWYAIHKETGSHIWLCDPNERIPNLEEGEFQMKSVKLLEHDNGALLLETLNETPDFQEVVRMIVRARLLGEKDLEEVAWGLLEEYKNEHYLEYLRGL